MAGRRAVMRWSARLFRREWRSQALVLALLTVSVAAAITLATVSFNVAALDGNAMFGTANFSVQLDGSDPDLLAQQLDAMEQHFGTIDVVGHHRVAVPGAAGDLDHRSVDPEGAYSGPMLALVAGRFPGTLGEAAVTEDLGAELGVSIGDTIDLDDTARRVVGMIENPSDLTDRFVLVSPDTPPAVAEVLVRTTDTEMQQLRLPGDADRAVSTRGAGDDDTKAAVAVLGILAAVLLLVALVSAASFAAVAQRRLRQLGMLGAIGATDRHLRLVVVANGFAVGVTAALVGAVTGLVAWRAVAPRIESGLGSRIDPGHVPWGVVVGAMGLALGAAAASAYWPARSMARVPITSALASQMPRPVSTRHSARAGIALLVVGIVALVVADGSSLLLVVPGTLAALAGILLLSPTAVGALGAVAPRLPVAPRLALRDLARTPGRSSLAVAALALSLGIASTVVLASSAAEASKALGNLAPNQLVVWTRDSDAPPGVSPFYTEDRNDSGFAPFLPNLSATDLEEREAAVAELASELGAHVTNLDLAVDPAAETVERGRLSVTLAQATSDGTLDVALLYVASETLLEHYGVDLNAVDPETAVLTVDPSEHLPRDVQRMIESDELLVSNTAERVESAPPVEYLEASFSALPSSFITAGELREQGWETARAGWLLETDRPITPDQLLAARDGAAGADLLVESRQERADLSGLRAGATLAAALLALGVIAMTVGLTRAEAAADLRTLTAAGATRRIRRSLTAATAGALALAGAVLGTMAAYVSVGSGYLIDLADLTPIPVVDLTAIVLGVPLLAAGAAWLLAGREPRQSVAR